MCPCTCLCVHHHVNCPHKSKRRHHALIWDNELGQTFVACLVFGFVTRRIWFTRAEVKHSFPNPWHHPTERSAPSRPATLTQCQSTKGLPLLLHTLVYTHSQEQPLGIFLAGNLCIHSMTTSIEGMQRVLRAVELGGGEQGGSGREGRGGRDV